MIFRLEKWKKISQTHYSASTLGRIRNDDNGRYLRSDSGSNHGYTNVCIRTPSGIQHVSTQRVIAYAFGLIDSWDDPRDVDHINGNRMDCRLCNLRAITHKDNCRTRKGPRKARTIIVRNKDTNEIIGDYATQHDIHVQLGVSQGAISLCLNHKKGYHSSHGYTFEWKD